MTDKSSPYYPKLSQFELKLFIIEMFKDSKTNLPELGGVSN